MTKPERTYDRPLEFNLWIKDNLPDSNNGFRVSDLDFILYNRKNNRLMLLEVKTRRGYVEPWQRQLFDLLDSLIKSGTKDYQVEYLGLHYLIFTGETPFEDGSKCRLDGKTISEEHLIKFLSMN